MAIPASSCNPSLIKFGLALIALSIAGYILGPPLYWHFKEGLAVVSRSSSSSACPPCFCDCPSQPVISIPEGTFNFFVSNAQIRLDLFWVSSNFGRGLLIFPIRLLRSPSVFCFSIAFFVFLLWFTEFGLIFFWFGDFFLWFRSCIMFLDSDCNVGFM